MFPSAHSGIHVAGSTLRAYINIYTVQMACWHPVGTRYIDRLVGRNADAGCTNVQCSMWRDSLWMVPSWLVATLDADYRMVRFSIWNLKLYTYVYIYYSCIQESQVAGRTTMHVLAHRLSWRCRVSGHALHTVGGARLCHHCKIKSQRRRLQGGKKQNQWQALEHHVGFSYLTDLCLLLPAPTPRHAHTWPEVNASSVRTESSAPC